MVKPIVTDTKILAIPSEPVQAITPKVQEIIKDLRDTATHHAKAQIGCAGLAANQIGYLYRIVLVWNGDWVPMINPKIQFRDGKTNSSNEGCLSRPGVCTKVRRHKRIRATWMNPAGILLTKKFTDWPARVIQHEVDHLNGIFIKGVS